MLKTAKSLVSEPQFGEAPRKLDAQAERPLSLQFCRLVGIETIP